MATPSLNWPFFISPVSSIIEPSCALISASSVFGPFIRRCIPSRISKLPGSSSVLGPAVKMYPLEQPGTATRSESFGTGFFSWPASPVVSAAAIAMAAANLVIGSILRTRLGGAQALVHYIRIDEAEPRMTERLRDCPDNREAHLFPQMNGVLVRRHDEVVLHRTEAAGERLTLRVLAHPRRDPSASRAFRHDV